MVFTLRVWVSNWSNWGILWQRFQATEVHLFVALPTFRLLFAIAAFSRRTSQVAQVARRNQFFAPPFEPLEWAGKLKSAFVFVRRVGELHYQ